MLFSIIENIQQSKGKMARVIQYNIALGKHNFARLHDDQTGNKENHILFELVRRRPLLPEQGCYQPEETLFGFGLWFLVGFFMLAKISIN